MTDVLYIHPETPQPRLIRQAVEVIRDGGLIAYPTDTTYALGCCIGEKAALERLIRLRQLDKKHQFSLLCQDLSVLAIYAKVENPDYRLLKAHTPGPYTFILNGTTEVPRRLMDAKKRTIGIRVPDNKIAMALLEEMGEPLMTSSLILPGEELPLSDPYEIRERLEHTLDLVVDGGFCGFEATTVIDMTDETPELLRQGVGDASAFL